MSYVQPLWVGRDEEEVLAHSSRSEQAGKWMINPDGKGTGMEGV